MKQRYTIACLALCFLTLIISNPLLAAPLKSYTEPATGIKFVLVPGGCFEMGNIHGGGSYTEYPAHDVCVDSFYIGTTEVTQGQWKALMETNPSSFKLGDNYPVETLSRKNISQFAKKMEKKSDKGFRLPTEAEWEFACRSGGKEEKFCGSSHAKEVAWFQTNAADTVHPVAEKKPNSLGLYDMSGNVWELCSDIFSRDYYKNSPKQNPQGAETGRHYIKRGGSWDINENFQRASTRGRGSYDEKHYSTGFRLVFPAE
ncbi:MAG: formylglycine-generating enzyme family protein [Desulfuromonas sp.]|nr:MAG: formylglycine-generating enzyme family protein [Desulfuromonas sp.]